MLRKIILCILLSAFCCVFLKVTYAAPIENVRSSITPARVRIVLDSKEAIKYKLIENEKAIVLEFANSSFKAGIPKIKDELVQKMNFQNNGKNSSKLEIKFSKKCRHSVFSLSNPHRLVIDLFKIEKINRTSTLQSGIVYRFIQDELDGKQYQAHIILMAPNTRFELRPFSAAGAYNGRGSLASRALNLGLLAAINSSYFDADGWVVGNTKDKGKMLSMDEGVHSAFAVVAGKPVIIKDLYYNAFVELKNSIKLPIKGMNRARIAEDCVLFNDSYAPKTKTNQWGREIKIKNERVISVSSLGNMPIEPGTIVISGHGANAKILQAVHVGDKAKLFESFNNTLAAEAETIIGAGPLLLENANVNVRSVEEHIAPDIAYGRAPRTALGIKADGTVLLAVVDGRSTISCGMTLVELAQFLKKLGAKDALNFDGGGSSEMVIKGRIVNKPSDGKERLVSMGLGLFLKRT